MIYAALFGASSVLGNENVARKTAAAVCGYARTAPSRAGQTLRGAVDGIAVEGSGASLLTFSSSLEGEVGIGAIGLAGEGRVVLVIIDRESWAIGEALANMEI